MKAIKLLLGLFFLLCIQGSIAKIYVTPEAPQTKAQSYVLMDQKSGYVLASKNAHERLVPASLTKLMTSYIVFNKIKEKVVNLDDKVRISRKAWQTTGSKSFLKIGDQVPLKELLKGMIIQSGNDASVAIAEHIAGSENTFVDLMNRYAQALGLNNTHFENASGLPAGKNHYSSAFDLAILSKLIISEFPEFYAWYKNKSFTYNNITQRNRNRLLWLDNSVDGLKTGHTNDAGYCLAASAKRVDMRLITVLLNAEDGQQRIEDTQRILDYGFRFFETQAVTLADEVLADIKLYKGENATLPVGLDSQYYLTVARGRFKELDYQLNVNESLSAPIEKSQVVGELKVKLDDEVLQTYPLVAMEDAKLGGFFSEIIDSIKLMF